MEVPSTGIAIRISEIPIGVSKNELFEMVNIILACDSGGANDAVVILNSSLAASPADPNKFQIATVTLSVPPKLNGTRFETMAGRIPAHISFDKHFFGMTPLSDGAGGGGHTVDIIFVTGLAGHAFGSWKARGANTMWIRDFLASDIDDHVPGNVRILTYGYDSTLFANNSNAGVTEFARSFLEAIINSRRQRHEFQRPIIFVAHSLGGIVVKQALVDAANGSAKEKLVLRATYACIFLGVPNRGLNVEQLMIMVKGQQNERLVSDLGVGSQRLRSLHNSFCQSFNFKNSQIISVYETKLSKTVEKSESGRWTRTGPEIEMVTKESAVFSAQPGARYHQLSRDVDHSNLAKFTTCADQDYINLRGRIIDCVEEAPSVIEGRFIPLNENVFGKHAVHCPFDIPFELEFSKNPNFTGRDDLLGMIDTEVRSRVSKVIVLYGLGGIGKTQIALEYTHTHYGEYSSVFWVDGTSLETVTLGFRSISQRLVRHHVTIATYKKPDYTNIGQLLGIDIEADGRLSATGNVVEGIKRWFCQHENQNWLLVLDNVDDLQSFDISSFIPPASHGTILITSRRKDCTRLGKGVEIEEMLELEGICLLFRSAKLHDSQGKSCLNLPISKDRTIAAEIVKQLGYLPLAIDQAGAYIATHEMQLQTYRQLYEVNFRSMFGERPQSPLWSYRDQTVFTTWEISFKEIETKSRESAELLSLCSFLHNEDIWEKMLRRGQKLTENDITLSNTLKPLFSYSLVHRKGRTDSFYIHPLVHLWARERLSPADRQRKAGEAATLLGQALETGVERQSDQWKYEERIMTHVDIVRGTAAMYMGQAKGSPTERLWMGSLGKLAVALWHQGRAEEAEVLELRVLEASMRVLGNEHPDTLTAMAHLAATHHSQGRWAEVEVLELRVLETSKRVLGNEDPNTLTAMADLASTYNRQGRWAEAEELLLRMLEASKRVLGNEHPDTLTAMAHLAVTYSSQRHWVEAEKLQLRVLEASMRVLGNEHPDTLTAMADLASTYNRQGRWAEAEELLLRMLEASKRVLGNEHPNTLTAMAHLATTHHCQGRWTEAEELQLRVLETSKRVLGNEHPNTLTAMAHLAVTYSSQRHWVEAEKLQLRMLEAGKRVLSNEHPDTLTAMGNLASIYHRQGRWAESEELELRVLEARKRVLGNEHPDTLNSMANLAMTYHRQRRWAEVEVLELRVLEARKRVLGNEHPDTLTAMANLAVTYNGQGRRAEAEKLELKRPERGFENDIGAVDVVE